MVPLVERFFFRFRKGCQSRKFNIFKKGLALAAMFKNVIRYSDSLSSKSFERCSNDRKRADIQLYGPKLCPKGGPFLLKLYTLPKMNECPLKGDYFNRKLHLPTIDFQGIF